ncbi:MAG: carboxypeptidase-like regulatory domain-containing protein [Pseudoflavonifractor sp.]|nr:carboxypeptidase-like regulatory domain-containing protein [Pseudoflavonifractor sp.]
MNKFLYAGSIVLLAASFASCKNDDPGIAPAPPTVELAPNTLTGIITDQQGEPVSDATVTAGSLSATTDANGVYTINGIPAGKYEVSASHKYTYTAKGSVTIADSKNTVNSVWCAQLITDPNASGIKRHNADVNVTTTAGGHGDIETTALRGNDKAEVLIGVSVDPSTVPASTNIIITPVYSYETASLAGRAQAEDGLLLGANVSSSDANLKLQKPIDLTFNVDNSVSDIVETRRLVGDKWETVDHDINADGDLVIPTDQLGTFGLFVPMEVSETPAPQAIALSPKVFDNLYGKSVMNITGSSYDYFIGGTIDSGASNSLEALLVEQLARMVSSAKFSFAAEYPLNMQLPIGTGVELKATQQNTKVTITSTNGAASGLRYGPVTVSAISYNRDHNGGSN